jgi:hypothetical protein
MLRRIVVHEGGSAFAPRGTAHSFQNFTNAPVEILALVAPGVGFIQFFEELSSLGHADPAAVAPVAMKYGIEVIGPPLS